MSPTDERLGSAEDAASHVDDRLIEHLELIE
jgi:hypothetical protein